MTQTQTLIVGGGLSGLAVADALQRQNADFHLVEARSRFGGRILCKQRRGGAFDLGPAWIWPGQHRITNLFSRFDLPLFKQHAKGMSLYEDDRGQLHHIQGVASMAGAWRAAGGMATLTQAMSQTLDADRLHLATEVTAFELAGHEIIATTKSGQHFRAERVVLALPPRIAAQLMFVPTLSDTTQVAMQSVPTWMAGQAKAIVIYDRPFWRDHDLSGDAISRIGPLAELHDACATSGTPAALFGFLGVPAHGRQDQSALRAAVIAQMVRLFGPEAANPEEVVVIDWAQEKLTATQADHSPARHHPDYGLPEPLQSIWDGRLIFAGTEVAADFGGLLEGALEAAEHAVARLTQHRS